MRTLIIAALMTVAFSLDAFAQAQIPGGGGPKPNGQTGSVCLARCEKALAECREPGKTNGIPPNCAPRYNACVKNCK